MRAIATQFSGIVFRSRTEAYLYEYLRLLHNPDVMDYEPIRYRTDDYVPDLTVSSEVFHFAVEIKPSLDKANWKLYFEFLNTFSDIQHFYVYTPRDYQCVDRYGNHWEGLLNRMVFIQAQNNVKHELNLQGNGR